MENQISWRIRSHGESDLVRLRSEPLMIVDGASKLATAVLLRGPVEERDQARTADSVKVLFL